MAAWDGCECGWLRPAALSLLVLWVACLPAGLALLIALRLRRAAAAGRIRFRRPAGAGSWRAYTAHVRAARGDPARVVRPAAVHAALRAALGAGGAVCGLMGLRAATARDAATAAPLAAASALLSFAAARLASGPGRRVVVAATNALAAAVGWPGRFEIDTRTGAVGPKADPKTGRDGPSAAAEPAENGRKGAYPEAGGHPAQANGWKPEKPPAAGAALRALAWLQVGTPASAACGERCRRLTSRLSPPLTTARLAVIASGLAGPRGVGVGQQAPSTAHGRCQCVRGRGHFKRCGTREAEEMQTRKGAVLPSSGTVDTARSSTAYAAARGCPRAVV
jgi:hypothetical protein